MRLKRADGFTLVELLIVVTIIGVLASIAIPATREAKRKAEAASVIADVNAIRAGTFDYFDDNQDFPRSAGWGSVPRGLETSLPNGFSFASGRTTYRWVRYGRRRAQRTGQLGVIMIRSNDRDLIRAIKGLYAGALTGNGRRLTLIIS